PCSSRRNTPPNTTSSTSRPIATENVSPAAANIAAIALSISCSADSLPFRRTRHRGSVRHNLRSGPEHFGRFSVALIPNLHLVADSYAREQLLNVGVGHANAPVRGRVPNRMRRIRTVNAVALLVEPEPAGADRVLRA